jgi:hypothetical protein
MIQKLNGLITNSVTGLSLLSCGFILPQELAVATLHGRIRAWRGLDQRLRFGEYTYQEPPRAPANRSFMGSQGGPVHRSRRHWWLG